MGAAILRVSKMQEKWRAKITLALASDKSKTMGDKAEKYALFLLPFITILREGLEAVIFVGGVGLSFPGEAFPLPVVCGMLAGGAVGWFIYK